MNRRQFMKVACATLAVPALLAGKPVVEPHIGNAMTFGAEATTIKYWSNFKPDKWAGGAVKLQPINPNKDTLQEIQMTSIFLDGHMARSIPPAYRKRVKYRTRVMTDGKTMEMAWIYDPKAERQART